MYIVSTRPKNQEQVYTLLSIVFDDDKHVYNCNNDIIVKIYIYLFTFG